MISPIYTVKLVPNTRLILQDKLELIFHESQLLPIKMSWKDTELAEKLFQFNIRVRID